MVAKLGGADISWLVGIVVTFVLYYVLIRNRGVAPKETIYPTLEELERK